MTVRVTVTADHEVTAETSGIVFTNTYGTEPVTVELMGTKQLEGRPLVEDEFLFAVYGASVDQDGDWEMNPNPINVVSSDADGIFTFHTRTYSTVGTYHYIIREINNMSGGVIYDTDPVYLTYVVEDNGEGCLQLTAYAKKGESYGSVDGMTPVYGPFTSEGSFTDADRDALKDAVAFSNRYEIDGWFC